MELFGPQPNITCEFAGTSCTELQAPDCALAKASEAVEPLQPSIRAVTAAPSILGVLNL